MIPLTGSSTGMLDLCPLAQRSQMSDISDLVIPTLKAPPPPGILAATFLSSVNGGTSYPGIMPSPQSLSSQLLLPHPRPRGVPQSCGWRSSIRTARPTNWTSRHHSTLRRCATPSSVYLPAHTCPQHLIKPPWLWHGDRPTFRSCFSPLCI